MSFIQELRRRNVLRVGAAYVFTAWLVIQVVETLFPIYGLPDVAIRMVVNLLAVGLLPVLILTWVFEWTPEGLKRESHAVSNAPATSAGTRRFDRMIIVMLVLALSYFVLEKVVGPPRAEDRPASIAVLAFADMSPDKGQEYLSDGIPEEILQLLDQVEGLRVISRTSAFSYKGRNIPIPVIAQQLNVAHVLEGSVRKVGDRIRVTAQLIDADSDTRIWSETFDRTLNDIFAIQDEIAAATVSQLQIKLLGDLPTQDRINPEAYLLWLEGHHLVAYVDPARATLLLEQVVDLEPEFADAWRDLVRSYLLQSPTLRQANHEGDTAWFKAKEAEKRLEEIDPNHPWILSSRAWDAADLEGDLDKAARLMERALAAHPEDLDVIRAVVKFARWIRRDEIALALMKPVVRKDPLCPDCSYHYSRSAFVSGRYDEAIAEIRRFKSLGGKGGEITLCIALLLTGQIDQARAVVTALQEDAKVSPHELGFLSRARYLDLVIRLHQGESPAPISEIEELDSKRESGGSVSTLNMAELYTLAGEHDRALVLLRKYVAKASPAGIGNQISSPLLGGLHDDPRWLALLESVGLAPHQLADIEFDPKMP